MEIKLYAPMKGEKFFEAVLLEYNPAAGNVTVDAGAAQALLRKGGSLLPGGVRRVEGAFQKGALVRVLHEGQSLGVGLSNYSAADLKKIMGLKRHEVAAILGDAHYPEVIHRDNLLLDAAV